MLTQSKDRLLLEQIARSKQILSHCIKAIAAKLYFLVCLHIHRVRTAESVIAASSKKMGLKVIKLVIAIPVLLASVTSLLISLLVLMRWEV